MEPDAPATLADLLELLAAMPEALRVEQASGAVYYAVRGRSFVVFRSPRPDALDPETGERLTDVVVFWVRDPVDKEALVGDPSTPFFTTPHFDGHPSVLLRLAHLDRLTRDELAEVVEDAWLARAPKRLATAWLAEHSPAGG